MSCIFKNLCYNLLNNAIYHQKYQYFKCKYTTSLLLNRKISIEEKLGLKPRPKKPISVFMRFLMKMRPKILQRNPHTSVTEMTKIVSEEWRKIDPKLKDDLQEEYKNDLRNYMEDCIEYDKNLTSSDKIKLLKAKETEKTIKEGKARKKEMKELNLNPKPKKPPTVFLRFCINVRPQIRIKNPNASLKEISDIASEEWKKIDASLKKKLEEEFKNDWLKYIDKCKEYDKNNVSIDKNPTAICNKEKKLLKLKERQILGYPKKPLNSFLLFMQDRASQRGQLSFQEWRNKIVSQWKSVPEAEKENYIKRNKKEMEEYKLKLEKWKEEMVEKGHKDMVISQA